MATNAGRHFRVFRAGGLWRFRSFN
jgi:hypothetical protein